MDGIRMYGAAGCTDCKRAKELLGEYRIRYELVDVDEDHGIR